MFIKPPTPLHLDGEIVTTWSKVEQRFQIFLTTPKIDQKDKKTKLPFTTLHG